MTIKILIVSSDNSYYQYLTPFLNSYPNLQLEITDNPDTEKIAEQRYDIVILDSSLVENWIQFHQIIKNAYINNVFVLLLDKISVDEVKKGFKDGIYDILHKDLNKEEFLSIFQRVIETAKILKSTEKIHKYCTHTINIILPSDVTLVNETVLQIINTLRIAGFIKELDLESNLRLVLTEAIANAIVHGNKSDINKKVTINATINDKEFKTTVEDMGNGFDIKKIDNPLDEDNILKSSGRGIYLMKTIMDNVIFEKNGSKIILIKKKDS